MKENEKEILLHCLKSIASIIGSLEKELDRLYKELTKEGSE